MRKLDSFDEHRIFDRMRIEVLGEGESEVTPREMTPQESLEIAGQILADVEKKMPELYALQEEIDDLMAVIEDRDFTETAQTLRDLCSRQVSLLKVSRNLLDRALILLEKYPDAELDTDTYQIKSDIISRTRARHDAVNNLLQHIKSALRKLSDSNE